MFYLKWNSKDDKPGAMKQARLFLSKDEFKTWYDKNKHDMKNILIPCGSALRKEDLA